jgi:hypothetical protein
MITSSGSGIRRMSVGFYHEVDPLGLAAGVNPYQYVGGNPVTRVDPLGLDWVYHQSTGQMQHVDSNGNSTNVGNGYAGQNNGLNNPAYQNVPGTGPNTNGGPLPQGNYTIGPQQDNVTSTGKTLYGSMSLIPDASNNMFDRNGFLIHGDNSLGNQSASEGYIVFNRGVRNQIGQSDDNKLRVVP